MALIEGRYYTGSMTDKRHDADGLSWYMKKLVSSGVISLGTNLQVTAGTGAVSVNFGEAIISGYMFRIRDNGEGVVSLPVVSGTRKDRVVIRKDSTEKSVYIYVKQGSAGTPPTLENTNDAEEISLALLSVSGTTVTVTDERTKAGNLLGLNPIDVYPVGSIYLSVNSASPATLFGGTWERIQDTFLLAAGTNHAAGTTGGAETVILTTAQIPLYALWMASNGYTPGLSIAVNGGSAYGMTTYNTGGGQAHNNMPPFLAVYVWKRTA